MQRVLFGPSPDSADIERWKAQKFCFSKSVPFALEQSHGGPCGVLAPVQAWLMVELLSKEFVDWPKLAPEILEKVLRRIVHTASSNESEVFNSETPQLSDLSVLDFLTTVVQARGIENIKNDMDDPDAPLIGRFGHCSQEVLNLMMFGKATSNVFDGDQKLDECLVLRGVPETPSIGLLSELEALRYVTVGSRLKNPLFPVWVLGSPSHYTVLFVTQNSSAYISPARDDLREAFEKFQLDEGIALAEALPQMFEDLKIEKNPNIDQLVQEGIVLWPDFAKWARDSWPERWPSHSSSEEVPSDLEMNLLDGQSPVTLSKVVLSKNSLEAQPGTESIRSVLRTKWPNMYVSISPAIM